MSLSFLNNITVAAAAVKSTVVKGGSTAKKQRQPLNGADLRVWRDGSIYPSAALIAEFDLEYRSKSIDAEEKGYGFDIVNALSMTKQIQGVTEDFLMIGAVKRNKTKVDIFGSCTFDKDDQPSSPVSEQGATTYGKNTLLPLLKSTYNLEPNDEGYIDLAIVRDAAMQSPNGIFLLPKAVTRSATRAGEIEYLRRENETLYPIVAFAMVDGEVAQGNETLKKDDSVLDEVASTTTSVTEESALVEHHGYVSLSQEDKADPIDYSTAEFDHVVTKEDLDANAPDLENAGVQVGDTVGIPAQEDPFLN